MKTFITEEMQLRQRAIEYAKKYNNNSKAVVKYHTTRQQIKRWRDRYDGTIISLTNKSRKPKSHPNQYTLEELELIKQKEPLLALFYLLAISLTFFISLSCLRISFLASAIAFCSVKKPK